MGLCDKVNELNLSALCKKERKKKQEPKKLNYTLYFVPNLQKQTNETLFTYHVQSRSMNVQTEEGTRFKRVPGTVWRVSRCSGPAQLPPGQLLHLQSTHRLS